MAVVEVENVSKRYQERGQPPADALRGVSVKVETGEFMALAGPSGSGKTTLLNLIGGLDAPTGGTIRVDGKDISRMGRAALADLRRDRIGFVFQAYNLIPVLSARENVEFVMELQGVHAGERGERARKLLAEVGLAELADKRPLEMSGGQQQRVAVARAIASGPRIVLADEPTANLDSHTAGQLLDLMHRMNREHGVTFLFSTHDPLVIEKATRVVRLHDGRIARDERR